MARVQAYFRVEPSPYKFQQIEVRIRELTRSLPLGARLPPERELAESFDCNFLTVRRALKALVDDGTVVRRIGSGTYVAKKADGAPALPATSARKVGALVDRRSDAYAYRVLQALSEAALSRGVNLRTGWVGEFDDSALLEARRMASEGCEALVLPWFPHERAEAVRTFVARSPLPVCLPEPISGLEKNCFVAPGRFGDRTLRATAALCDYFEALGCARIAFLGPNSATDSILQKALSAYVCHRAEREADVLCGLTPAGAGAMDRLAERWARHRGELAVVCYDDEHALRLMIAMHKRGLSAPGDFRVAGFNGTEASAFSDPPLTTISQDFANIGSWMLANALALVSGGSEQSPGNDAARLLVRETCGGAGRIDAALRAATPGLEIAEASSGVLTVGASATPAVPGW